MINSSQKNNVPNNKRIAKNTILLYFRQFFIMIISLYTVRVVLSTLGIVDYGLFNVIGGIVVMFSFLSNTMSSATQRFFAFDLGKNNNLQVGRLFGVSILIYLIIAIILLLFAETFGYWFLNNKLVIPKERLDAANWVFQFSISSFFLTILIIPYNALIIANEDMAFYAYISILEVLLKLLSVYILFMFALDKLKLYSFLLFISNGIISFIYVFFCVKKYKVSIRFLWDFLLFKKMFNFSIWKMIGTISSLFSNYGVNIIMNIFFGASINAAKAISNQINSAISSFSSNFYIAVKPQITKSYSNGNIDYMQELVFRSSRYSYFLLLLISMPLIINTSFILNIWLDKTTPSMILFTKLILIFSLLNSLENPLTAMIQANGNIKRYELFVGCFTLTILPVSYVFYKLGFPSETSFYVIILVYFIAYIIRLKIIKSTMGISIGKYLKEVFLNVFLVTIISSLLPIIVSIFISNNNWINFILLTILSLLSILITVYFIGLTNVEQKYLLSYFLKYVK